MAPGKLLAAIALALNIPAALTGPLGVQNEVDFGTFQSPASTVRPRFRFWVNDASHNLTIVAEDVKAMGRAGAGGVELLGYYLYGDSANFGGQLASPLQSDWAVYGFGTDAWKNLLKTVLKAAKEADLVVDMALGPNQGAGVPSEYDNEGLLWDLAPFNVSVSNGGTFDDILPGWGTGSLVAAVTGTVISSNNSSSGSRVMLQDDSLTDVTTQVNSEGHLKVHFPATSGGTSNIVFAYYSILSGYREVESPADVAAAVPQSPITNYVQNGSLVVDHFSAAGAQLVIDFWNRALLDDETKSLVRAAGNYLWEDSMEMSASIWWTPKLPSVFKSNRGYDVGKYLPVLISSTNSNSDIKYITDEDDSGSSHIVDYEQTLTELYQEYLDTLTKWSNNLGIQYSSQVSYNLPMDMLSSIPSVDAPECESLGFSNNLDSYRQFSGPANLAGKRVISNEAGAVMGSVYQQTISSLIWVLKRGFAGSVNNYILHGYPYSGNYGNTTWPGFTTFAYLFSEMHGPRQPAFGHYRDFLDWLSRTQFITQTGVPKVDLVFWSKSMDAKPSTIYPDDDLVTAGYTYEYLSPDNFALPEAFVSDGVFAPRRQAFKAMIVSSNSTLTEFGVQKLTDYAHAGLPIVFLGGLPSSFSGYNPHASAQVSRSIESLSKLSNVHVAPSQNFAKTLSSLKIFPRASTSSNGTWYTTWREDESTDTDYVYIFNDAKDATDGGATAGTISFETIGSPYFYDAWSGEVTPISIYNQTKTQTTIPLLLAGNQSIIVGFQRKATPFLHILNSATGVIKAVGSSKSVDVFRSFDTENRILTLSNGKSSSLSPMNVDAFIISNWSLVVESWTPPMDLYDIEGGSVRNNYTFKIPNLKPWTSISDSLANVSGRGYYSASFDWPPMSARSGKVSGAFLDLGTISHTARAKVNGHDLAPLDLTSPKADIGKFLISGTNSVEITVSTPMGNSLRPYWDVLETSGKLATKTVASPPALQDYGLVSSVRVIPYRIDRVY